MNTTSLFIFFLLALLCVGISITNYLNITIIGDENNLSDFKGNRSNFLQIDGESTVITSFDEFGDPEYKSNALTVQDTPVKIQVLNSADDNINPPSINIVNTSTPSTVINFKVNDTNSDTGSKTINNITVTEGNVNFTQFFGGSNALAITNNYNVYSPCLFNLSPYLDTVTEIKNQGYYNITSQGTYVITPNSGTIYPEVNHNTFWFSLPTKGGPGDAINFIFTGTNCLQITNGTILTIHWGPPNYIKDNSVIENYNSENGNFASGVKDSNSFGAFVTPPGSNVLSCSCDSGIPVIGGQGDNTSVAGLVVKFSAVKVGEGIKWAVEVDTVYPFLKFKSDNQSNWNPPQGTAINIPS